MEVRPDNPLIVQSDHTVLLEVDGPFAELVKSPEHIHTSRITPLSIWNAAAAGHSADEMVETLTSYAKYQVPQNVIRDIQDYASRYGRIRLVRDRGLENPVEPEYPNFVATVAVPDHEPGTAREDQLVRIDQSL